MSWWLQVYNHEEILRNEECKKTFCEDCQHSSCEIQMCEPCGEKYYTPGGEADHMEELQQPTLG